MNNDIGEILDTSVPAEGRSRELVVQVDENLKGEINSGKWSYKYLTINRWQLQD